MTAKNLGLHPHISKYRSKEHKVLEFTSTDLNESPKIMGPYLNENYSQMPLRHRLQHKFNPKTRDEVNSSQIKQNKHGKEYPPQEKISNYLSEG